jgi:hypothetical protein
MRAAIVVPARMSAATPAAHAVDAAAVEGAELTPEVRDKGASERSRDLQAPGLATGPAHTPHLQESTARGIHQQALRGELKACRRNRLPRHRRSTTTTNVTGLNRPGFGRRPIHHLYGG